MLFGNDVAVQSQLLRQFVASELVHPPRPWDWRDASPAEIASEKKEITQTVDELKTMFSS
jgi:hypothetical protein